MSVLQCVTASQLTLVAQLGRTADSTELRADIAQMLGTAGKMTLHKTPPNSEILSVRCVPQLYRALEPVRLVRFWPDHFSSRCNEIHE